ncbi:acyltransferase family protein [Pseudolactococcus insecticola]|uniref:Acyltransferase n=1 Tax=Pseudolactococcus insecticola TaxID=2709158 RepID=A0A6A0B553_9LACT|nr:acyltransferase family protein [Lactococcus insecticola]GFH40510.1 acyltransferase [Lactococcus insecticola]
MKIKWFSLVRVTGLVTVLGYHFFAKVFPGGFIGVDIFFVFSGYLITSLFFVELEKSETFDLLKYYQRRFLRIFPPLIIMVVTTLPFTLLLPSDFRANLAKQVTAAISFATNKFEIISGASYEAQQTPQLYIHTWTLSLEFLFYLSWGLLLFALIFVLKKMRFSGRNLLIQTRIFVLILAGLLSIISIAHLETSFNPAYLSYSYFAFTTHMYPFFIGAIVSVFAGIRINGKQQTSFANYPMKKWWIWTLVPLVLLVILTFFGRFESIWTVRTNLILTSILAAILIVQFRILHERTTAQEPKILTILADTSYSIYLFHWPVWLIISHLIHHVVISGVLSFIVSFAASAGVYYGIEPYFHGKSRPKWLMGKVFYGGLAALALAGIAITITAPKISKIERSINEAQISETMVALDKQGMLSKNLVDTGNGIFQNTSWYNSDAGFSTSADLQMKQTVLKDVTSVSNAVLNSSQTVLGDSVLVGVVPYLSNILPDADVDAKVGRNYDDIYQLYTQKLQAKKLGKYIVISAGANVTSDMKKDVATIVKNAPKGTHLVLVTAYDGKNQAVLDDFNTYLKTFSKKYDWVKIADWAAFIAPQDSLLWSDQIHFGGKQDVSVDYLNIIVKSLNQAAETAGKP